MIYITNVLSFARRRVWLCQSGGMTHTTRTVPLNIPIERITPDYLRMVIQLSIINLKIALEYEIYLLHLNSPRVRNGIVVHFTGFQHFHKICTMRKVLEKICFLTTCVISPYNFFSLLLIKKLGRGTATHSLKLT